MKINSIRFKTSVLYTSILGVILVVFSGYLLHTIRQILYKEEEEELLVEAREINDFIDVYAKIPQKDNSLAILFYQLFGGSAPGDKKLIDQLWEKESKALGLDNDFYRVRNLKDKVILRSSNLTDSAERSFNNYFAGYDNKIHYSFMKINGAAFYGLNYPMTFSNLNKLNLQLAIPVTYIQRVLDKLVLSLIGGIVVILLVGFFVGRYLAKRVLRPVMDVTRTANNITRKNLNLKIPVKELDREMEELVKSFNQMIGRLGDSFAYINDFNSHVAHEMKTPLAIIKGELELALSADNTKEEDKRVMKEVLQEVNRLIKIIKDMLLLAQYEYKLEIFKMERMDLTSFLKDVYHHSKVLTAEKNIALELIIQDGSIWIEGDAVHLRRVFFNLIHNAVKFTPVGGEVKIVTEVAEKYVFISIKDTGIGIASENQAKIFEKFYRIRLAEQEAIEGNGLGLSMARAIARAHKGDISFESEINKGSTFKVILPILLP